MSKVILTNGKETTEFENFELMFQDISEKGVIITKVEDGKLTTKDKKTMTFAMITTDGSEEAFKKEIAIYRDELRKTIVPLMKQGIVTKDQAGLLKEQFNCLEEK